MKPLSVAWRPQGTTALDELLSVTRGRRAVDLATRTELATTHPRPATTRTTALSLSGSPSRDVLETLRRDAARAIAAGSGTLSIDIDGLTTLDSAVIATLILVLRAARQTNGAIVLRAAREPIVETLRVTALDKIFTIEAPAG